MAKKKKEAPVWAIPLENLTESEFKRLKESGMLKVIYPTAPSSWEKIHPMKAPEAKNPRDFSDVVEMCKEHLSTFGTDEHSDDRDEDFKSELYETMMIKIFGKGVFENYINKLT